MQRSLPLDILKFTLALMVVALHTRFLSDINQHASYLLINGVFRMAVPIFFLINGYYFMQALSAPSLWFKRGLILYLIWMLIYSYGWFHPTGSEPYSLARTIKDLVIGYGHLWYIAAMLGAALLLYLLRTLSSRLLLALSSGLYLAGLTMQYLANYHVFKDTFLDLLLNTSWIYRSALFLAFPFFCIGYLIEKHHIHKKIQPSYLFLGAAGGLALLVGESYINFRYMVTPEEFDILISLLFLCPLIFMAFLSIDVNVSNKNLALYATSIYLVHFLVMRQFQNLMQLHGSMLTLATIVASAALSVVIVLANRKFKYLL